MRTQLLQPQEIEVFYVLPTIRRYFTQSLKQSGHSQKKIAALLHIRESTVSQYMNEKRGSQIQFSEEIQQHIQESSTKIVTKQDLIRETQKILVLIRVSGALCEIHKQMSNLGECDISEMRCS